MFREKPSTSRLRGDPGWNSRTSAGIGSRAPRASLMDHKEQATCSGSLARREPPRDTDVQKTTRQLGHTLRLFLPCEQHHHHVHVDDGDDWPTNREKRVPGFRSTKTPTHLAQTSQTGGHSCNGEDGHRPRQGQHSSSHSDGIEDGSLDCVAKANWRCQRHCHGGSLPPPCRPQHRPTIGLRSGGRNVTISVRFINTKPGGECVAHAIQTLTDLDSRATVLSIDGIGAFDLISRGAMLDGLLQSVEGGDAALPFVRQFYGTPSQDLWEDDDGFVHIIHQGEGGEQGDPLMPILLALGQHEALRSVQHFLRSDELLFA